MHLTAWAFRERMRVIRIFPNLFFYHLAEKKFKKPQPVAVNPANLEKVIIQQNFHVLMAQTNFMLNIIIDFFFIVRTICY